MQGINERQGQARSQRATKTGEPGCCESQTKLEICQVHGGVSQNPGDTGGGGGFQHAHQFLKVLEPKCGPGLHRVGQKSSHAAGSGSHSFPLCISHPLSSVLFSVAQSCLTLCNPLDYSPPGSSVHGVFQARILEWVATSSSREASRPRD